MNLKAFESNGLECISVNYILVSHAKESGRHDKIGLLLLLLVSSTLVTCAKQTLSPKHCMLSDVANAHTALHA